MVGIGFILYSEGIGMVADEEAYMDNDDFLRVHHIWSVDNPSIRLAKHTAFLAIKYRGYTIPVPWCVWYVNYGARQSVHDIRIDRVR